MTYQAIRRVWRFGQTRPVEIYFVYADIEGNVISNLKRKERDFEMMLDELSIYMIDIMKENVLGKPKKKDGYNPQVEMQLPDWLNADS